jgi:hypothetical protein
MTTWLTLAFAAAFFKAFATISEKEILLKKDIFDYVSAGSFLVAIISTPLLYFVKDMSLTLETIFFIFASSILSVTCALSLSYIVKIVGYFFLLGLIDSPFLFKRKFIIGRS